MSGVCFKPRPYGPARADTSYGPARADTSYGPARADTSYGPARAGGALRMSEEKEEAKQQQPQRGMEKPKRLRRAIIVEPDLIEILTENESKLLTLLNPLEEHDRALFNGQRNAITECLEFVADESSDDGGYVLMPPSSGKTIVFVTLAVMLVARGKNVLILTPPGPAWNNVVPYFSTHKKKSNAALMADILGVPVDTWTKFCVSHVRILNSSTSEAEVMNAKIMLTHYNHMHRIFKKDQSLHQCIKANVHVVIGDEWNRVDPRNKTSKVEISATKDLLNAAQCYLGFSGTHKNVDGMYKVFEGPGRPERTLVAHIIEMQDDTGNRLVTKDDFRNTLKHEAELQALAVVPMLGGFRFYIERHKFAAAKAMIFFDGRDSQPHFVTQLTQAIHHMAISNPLTGLLFRVGVLTSDSAKNDALDVLISDRSGRDAYDNPSVCIVCDLSPCVTEKTLKQTMGRARRMLRDERYPEFSAIAVQTAHLYTISVNCRTLQHLGISIVDPDMSKYYAGLDEKKQQEEQQKVLEAQEALEMLANVAHVAAQDFENANPMMVDPTGVAAQDSENANPMRVDPVGDAVQDSENANPMRVDPVGDAVQDSPSVAAEDQPSVRPRPLRTAAQQSRKRIREQQKGSRKDSKKERKKPKDDDEEEYIEDSLSSSSDEDEEENEDEDYSEESDSEDSEDEYDLDDESYKSEELDKDEKKKNTKGDKLSRRGRKLGLAQIATLKEIYSATLAADGSIDVNKCPQCSECKSRIMPADQIDTFVKGAQIGLFTESNKVFGCILVGNRQDQNDRGRLENCKFCEARLKADCIREASGRSCAVCKKAMVFNGSFKDPNSRDMAFKDPRNRFVADRVLAVPKLQRKKGQIVAFTAPETCRQCTSRPGYVKRRPVPEFVSSEMDTSVVLDSTKQSMKLQGAALIDVHNGVPVDRDALADQLVEQHMRISGEGVKRCDVITNIVAPIADMKVPDSEVKDVIEFSDDETDDETEEDAIVDPVLIELYAAELKKCPLPITQPQAINMLLKNCAYFRNRYHRERKDHPKDPKKFMRSIANNAKQQLRSNGVNVTKEYVGEKKKIVWYR